MMVSTTTNTYTSTRLSVIDDQFELFLRYAGLNDDSIDKVLEAIERRELEAVGAYVEKDGCRIAEVELGIDWKTHSEQVALYGAIFEGDRESWKDGRLAPEPYISVRRLTKIAKHVGAKIRTWIRVSDFVRSEPEKHKQVCDELGYSFGGKMAPWKSTPTECLRRNEDLIEISVIGRLVE